LSIDVSWKRLRFLLFLLTLIEFEVVVCLRPIAKENRKLGEFILQTFHIPLIYNTKLIVLWVKAHMYANFIYLFIFFTIVES